MVGGRGCVDRFVEADCLADLFGLGLPCHDEAVEAAGLKELLVDFE